MSLSDEIRDQALDLGFDAVGIAPADPFPQYAEAIAQRKDDYAWIPGVAAVGDPRAPLPWARSIVVAVYDYFKEAFPEALTGKVGRLYQARCYVAPPTRLGGMRQLMFRQFLESRGLQVGPWRSAYSGAPDRQAAVRAGLVRFGRNTFACAPGIGTFIMLNSFVVDAELEYDQPLAGLHCPPKCRLCIDACPTGAIVGELRMQPDRCVAFNTFSTQGRPNGPSAYIPKDIRPRMGAWIHGCDVCQEACPRNQHKLKAKLPPNAFLAKKAKEFDLLSILNLDEAYYARVVQPIMYNYIRDISLFRRNAAVALGNLGDRAAVPALTTALEAPEEPVRAHVAWALGRLGGPRARQALESALARETGQIAREEMAEALEGIGHLIHET